MSGFENIFGGGLGSIQDPATRQALGFPPKPGPWDGAFVIAIQARNLAAVFDRLAKEN